MANANQYPFQTGFKAHGHGPYSGQPHPPPPPPASKAPASKAPAYYSYAVAIIGALGAALAIYAKSSALLLGVDVEVAIQVGIGVTVVALSPQVGLFPRLMLAGITAFFVTAGCGAAMDMSSAALRQGLEATLGLSILFILSGWAIQAIQKYR